MPKALDLTNQTFGFLTAISKAPSRGGKTYWLCRCQCGVEKEIQTGHLISGSIKSCGSPDCIYHQQNKKQAETKTLTTRYCEICGAKFETNSYNRKYCYECSPTDIEKSKKITALRQAMKRQAVKMRGGKCEKCGYDKSIYALQFHHIDPATKSFGLSNGETTKSWAEYQQELQKCILLCANCHAEEHERLDMLNKK